MPFREKLKRLFGRSPPQPSIQQPQNQAAGVGEKNPNTPKNNEPSPTTTTTTTTPAAVPTIPTGMKAKPLSKRASRKQQKQQAANNGKPKIELYKPHKVPPSKYRGPFNQEHLDSLAAYTLPGAMADVRPRSMLSELSPMGTRAPPTRRGSAISEVGDNNGELSIDAALRLGDNSRTSTNDSDNTRTEIQTEETKRDDTKTSPLHPHAMSEPEADSDSTSVTAVGIEDISSPQVHTFTSTKPKTLRPTTTTTTIVREKVSSTDTLVPFAPAELTTALSAIQIRP